MSKKIKMELSASQKKELISILQTRFEKNKTRHKSIDWEMVLERLHNAQNAKKLWSLNEMEISGGEPDVIGVDKKSGEIIFVDCAAESPSGRRSLCYDREGMDSRKEFKPENTAMDMALEMGVALLTEDEYKNLQSFGNFDTKTSSWLSTPDAIRKLGGAIFGDRRYNTVFIYHNGAQSYYGGRGFRGILRL
jgi:hypothetical protein